MPNPKIETDHLGGIPRTNVSIKISSLSAKCDPVDTDGAIRDLMSRIVPILEAAKAKGVLINFDVEQFSVKDLTLELFMRRCERVDFHAGLAMQAYLKSGVEDATRVRVGETHGACHHGAPGQGRRTGRREHPRQQQGWPCRCGARSG